MDNDYMDNLLARIRKNSVILKTREEKEELLRAINDDGWEPTEREADGWTLILIWLYALVTCTIMLMWIGSW